jgi:ubiquinone/menaquinone biosynthesis C-methylase UbiE
MILRHIVALTERFPWLKRWAWRRWYQYLGGYRIENWSFMNYGYQAAEDDAGALSLDAKDEDDRYCIQLYHHVAAATDLQDLDVLEVGCGRGGGASFIQRYRRPKSMTAVDYSLKAIKLCNKKHSVEGLSFVYGDAESLPFDDNTFDAVVNVESSHCYGSMETFLSQVHRVLRPGGHFLFADFRSAEDVENLVGQLEESGMTVLAREDITANVVKALDLDDERNMHLIRRHVPRWLLRTVQQFAGMKGSIVYQGFQDGTIVYNRYLLRK